MEDPAGCCRRIYLNAEQPEIKIYSTSQKINPEGLAFRATYISQIISPFLSVLIDQELSLSSDLTHECKYPY